MALTIILDVNLIYFIISDPTYTRYLASTYNQLIAMILLFFDNLAAEIWSFGRIKFCLKLSEFYKL